MEKSDILKGTIIKSTGSWYRVRNEAQQVITCRIKGKFRLNGLKLTNPVAVGDKVTFEYKEGEEAGMIYKIMPRENYIVRQSPHKKAYLHLLAANIDQALLFVTIRHPKLKVGFIDRFLLTTAPFDIPTYIIFNKSDLYNEEDLKIYEKLKEQYENIGYGVVLVSALKRQNIEELKAILKDKISLVGGHSGVGKSTLLNGVQPHLDIRTQELSDYTGKGQHTTTFAEMHALDFGGAIIDTPGIKILAFNHFTPQDINHNFLEIFKTSEHCKYSNCMHINEPNCAVKQAVVDGEIAEQRYWNYCQLLEETESQNHWERNKDF